MRVREKEDDVKNYSDLASREENLIAELGVFVLDLTPRLRAKVAPERRESGGVLVAAREADGPVFEDNFQSGDVIYAVNREPVKDVQSLREVLRRIHETSSSAMARDLAGTVKAAAGRTIVKVAPWPAELLSSIRPPCAWAAH